MPNPPTAALTITVERTYRITDQRPERDAEWAAIANDRDARYDLARCPSIVLTWDELAEANDPDVMDEIATLEVGVPWVLGMCDPIERVS